MTPRLRALALLGLFLASLLGVGLGLTSASAQQSPSASALSRWYLSSTEQRWLTGAQLAHFGYHLC